MKQSSIRLALALSCAFLFGCNDAQQSDPDAAAQPADEAQSGSGVAVPGAHAEAAPPPAASSAGPEAVKGCLALVNAGDFEEALPTCLAALKADPDNPQLAKAIADTKAGVASLKANDAAAVAEESAAAAVAGAQGAAAKALEQAAAVEADTQNSAGSVAQDAAKNADDAAQEAAADIPKPAGF